MDFRDYFYKNIQEVYIQNEIIVFLNLGNNLSLATLFSIHMRSKASEVISMTFLSLQRLI
jgi:hypothetical protein